MIIRCLFILCLFWFSLDAAAQKQKRRYKPTASERQRMQESQEEESITNNTTDDQETDMPERVRRQKKHPELDDSDSTVPEEHVDKDSLLKNLDSTINVAKKLAAKNQQEQAITIINNLYDHMYDIRADIEEALDDSRAFAPDTLLLLTSKWNLELNDVSSALEDYEEYFSFINGTHSGQKLDLTILIYGAFLKYKMQSFNDAVTDFNHILANYKLNDSLQFYCHFYRGTSHYNLEFFDLAYQDFAKCAAIYPKKFEPHFNLGRCLFKDLMQVETLVKAIKHFDESLRLNPAHIPSLFLRGRSYEKLQKYQEALADFIRCTELDQTYAAAFFKKAYVTYRINKNKIRKSICEDFYKAVQLGSGDALIFYQEHCETRK